MSTDLLLQATKETFLMVVFSSFFAILIGLPFGIILTITRKGGIAENFPLYRILDGIINILRLGSNWKRKIEHYGAKEPKPEEITGLCLLSGKKVLRYEINSGLCRIT